MYVSMVASMDQIKFKIIFRKPEYPVIVVSIDRCYSGFGNRLKN